MPLHASTSSNHHQEVKIAFHGLWYHLNYMWPSRAQFQRRLVGMRAIYPVKILQQYASLSAITEVNLLALDGLGFANRKLGGRRMCVRTHWYLCVSLVQAVIKRQSCDPWDATNNTIKFSPVHHFHIQECVSVGGQHSFRTPDIALIKVLQLSGWSDYIRKSELCSFYWVFCTSSCVVVLHYLQFATVYTYCIVI